MSVQIWVLTVPRLASLRFLDFPPGLMSSRPQTSPTHAGKGENQHCTSRSCTGFHCLSYVLMYPVMFQHHRRAKSIDLFVHEVPPYPSYSRNRLCESIIVG